MVTSIFVSIQFLTVSSQISHFLHENFSGLLTSILVLKSKSWMQASLTIPFILMAVKSVSSKSVSEFTFPIRSETFNHNARTWILFNFSDDIDNPPLLRLLFLAAEIHVSMLSHYMFSKSMKSLYPSASTAAHYVQIRPTMVWRTLCSGINVEIAAALFAVLTNP